MAIYFSDTFTDTNGTSLPSHDAEWTDRNITTDIQNNQVEHNGASNTGDASAAHIQSSTITDTNYYVQADFNTGTLGNEFQGLVARRTDFDTVDNDGYFMFVDQDADEVTLYSRISGTWNNLDTQTLVMADSTTYTLRLEVDNGATNRVVGKVDDVEIVTSTDANITAKGDCGLGLGTGQSAVDDCWWDNFECGSLTTATVAPLAGRHLQNMMSS